MSSNVQEPPNRKGQRRSNGKFQSGDFANGCFQRHGNLSCSIAPAIARAPTCSLSASSLQIADGSAQQVSAAVTTIAPAASVALPTFVLPLRSAPVMWATSMCMFVFAFSRLRSRKCGQLTVTSIIIMLAPLVISCGGSGTTASSAHVTPGTPAGSYTATVTANAGGVSHSEFDRSSSVKP